MKKELVETLLATIMEWSDNQIVSERIRLEALAKYKYDEYQQFAPGKRFLESFALWLTQFETLEEKKVAYEFVLNRLVYIDSGEMNYLVDLVFPTVIRSQLLKDVSLDSSRHERIQQKNLIETVAYKSLLRRTLILGLSDGAHIGEFRRSTPSIKNEQVYHAYDISDDRKKSMLLDLEKDINLIYKNSNSKPVGSDYKFKYLVLLDDFTASGKTYVRKEKDNNIKGKVPNILKKFQDEKQELQILSDDFVTIVIILVASAQAIRYLESNFKCLFGSKKQIKLHVILTLSEDVKISKNKEQNLFDLIENPKYFDDSADDKHIEIGGSSLKYGFSKCLLPVVLSHNTPNNSIYLLHASESSGVSNENEKFRGLFPRISRHK